MQVDLEPFMVKKKVPFFTRLTNGTTQLIWLLASGILNIILAPIEFLRNLITRYNYVIDINKVPKDHPLYAQLGGTPTIRHEVAIPDEKEPWKDDHDELYGED